MKLRRVLPILTLWVFAVPCVRVRAQVNTIQSGATLPTSCDPAAGPNVFFKTTSPVGLYECTVAGSTGGPQPPQWTLVERATFPAAAFCATPGTLDDTCISNAIAACPAIGCTVVLPNATVLVGSGISISTGKFIRLMGSGPNSTLQKNFVDARPKPNNNFLINALGLITSTVMTLSQDVPVGSISVTGNVTGGTFSPLDWVEVCDQQAPAGYSNCELAQVHTVPSPSSLVFKGSLEGTGLPLWAAITSVTHSATICTINTAAAHNFVTNDLATVQNSGTGGPTSTCDGVNFRITVAGTTQTQFTYSVATSATASCSPPSNCGTTTVARPNPLAYRVQNGATVTKINPVKLELGGFTITNTQNESLKNVDSLLNVQYAVEFNAHDLIINPGQIGGVFAVAHARNWRIVNNEVSNFDPVSGGLLHNSSPVDTFGAAAWGTITGNKFITVGQTAFEDRSHHILFSENQIRSTSNCVNTHGTGANHIVISKNHCAGATPDNPVAITPAPSSCPATTGLCRASNTVTGNTATPHGFMQGDLIEAVGQADTTFAGRFAVATVPSTPTCGNPPGPCSFTYSQTAPDAMTGGGVVFKRWAATGILVLNQGAGQYAGDRDILIDGNDFGDYADPAIGIYGTTNANPTPLVGDVQNVTVTNNKIKRPAFTGGLPGGSCGAILVQYVRGGVFANNTIDDLQSSKCGFQILSADKIKLSGNNVEQHKLATGPDAATGDQCYQIVDSTNLTMEANSAIGCDSEGFHLEASSAGAVDKVQFSGNQAFNNGTNYNFVNPSNITNLVRNGNLNDNLTVLGGTGSRILDTFAASGPTGPINAGSFASVTVTWLPNPSGPPGALPGTNYAPTCTVQDVTTPSANTLRVHHIESATTTRVTARVVNDDTGAGHNGTLHCLAVFRCGLADGSPCPTQ